ncbi:DUF2474 family protein [Sphingopyxis sp. PAMC25046]|nr:DUF2474 family protein [Sphingopyxis sp. PAMC25046]
MTKATLRKLAWFVGIWAASVSALTALGLILRTILKG